MAFTLKLDGLSLIDGTTYEVKETPQFRVPDLRATVQPFLQEDGGAIVEGSDFFNTVTHTIDVYINGTSEDNLMGNIRSLQAKTLKRNIVLEYKHKNTTNSNFADVLFMSVDDPFNSPDWHIFLRNKKALMTIQLTCKPFWRGTLETISVGTLSPTPAVITASTVLGDVLTPATITFTGSSNTAYGNNLYVGARGLNHCGNHQILEPAFDPIHDFQGTNEAGTYNGQYLVASSSLAAGSSWVNITGAESGSLHSISMRSSTYGWAVGVGGLIAKTIDGWLTKTNQSGSSVTDNKTFESVHAQSTALVWVVGANAKVLRSTDGGTVWTEQATTITSPVGSLQSIYFASSNVGFMVGGQTTDNAQDNIWKTTDAGVTWTKSTQVGGQNILNSIYAPTSNTIYAVGEVAISTAGLLYKTTDGGATWSTGSAQPGLKINGSHFSNSSVGWIVGTDKVLRTTDGAASWSTQTSSGTNAEVAMAATDIGWTVGGNKKIDKTVDGAAWSTQLLGGSNLKDVAAISSSEAYAVGDGITVLKTTNGGTAWTEPIAAYSLPTPEYDGRYRVFARVRSLDPNSSSVAMRAGSGLAGGTIKYNSTITLAATTRFQWSDLGNITIPAVNVSSGIEVSPIIQIEVKSPNTGAGFHADVATLLPLDGETTFISTDATQAKPITMDFNSEAINKGADIINYTGTPGIQLRPGLKNNIVTLETQAQSSALSKTGINDVDVSIQYFPRYLSPVRSTS